MDKILGICLYSARNQTLRMFATVKELRHSVKVDSKFNIPVPIRIIGSNNVHHRHFNYLEDRFSSLKRAIKLLASFCS